MATILLKNHTIYMIKMIKDKMIKTCILVRKTKRGSRTILRKEERIFTLRQRKKKRLILILRQERKRRGLGPTLE